MATDDGLEGREALGQPPVLLQGSQVAQQDDVLDPSARSRRGGVQGLPLMPWGSGCGSGFAMAAICGSVMPEQGEGNAVDDAPPCQGRLASWSLRQPRSRGVHQWRAPGRLPPRLAASTGEVELAQELHQGTAADRTRGLPITMASGRSKGEQVGVGPPLKRFEIGEPWKVSRRRRAGRGSPDRPPRPVGAGW